MNIHVQNRKYQIIFLLISLFATLRLVWIGDCSFIGDEPALINRALSANSNYDLLPLGLIGSKGIRYGSIPIMYYRVLLFFSHDLIVVSLLHTLLITSSTLFGCYRLVKELKLFGSSLILIIFLSPYLWFYSRNMWDNSLNIPITLIGFSYYLSFINRRDFFSLSATFIILSLCLQVHLMALPFIMAILLHFAIFNINWIKTNLTRLSILLLICIVFCYPYLSYLASSPATIDLPSLPSWETLFFPFLGARFFSTFKFSYFLGPDWEGSINSGFTSNAVMYFISYLTFIAYPASWLGMYKSVTYLKSRYLTKKKDLMWHSSFLALTILLFHIILNCAKNLNTHPHYYNGVWVNSLFFMGVGFYYLNKIPFLKYSIPIYYSALLISLSIIILTVHFNHGSRTLHYGHTLKDQIEAAKRINSYSSAVSSIPMTFHTKYFPGTMGLLKKLYPYNGEKKEVTTLILKYKRPKDKNDASLEIVVE